MIKPTISEIKYNTFKTAPYFFSRDTMKMFKQTMKSFKVYRTKDNNVFLIIAVSRIDNINHYTQRYYIHNFDDVQNSTLEMVNKNSDKKYK